MKLRIRENSLRFRLSQSEVCRLCEAGRVEESVQFLDGLLRYEVATGGEAEALSARFQAGAVLVTVPASIATAWAGSNQVGIEGEQQVGNGIALHLMIEKDFKCLNERPNEDESDTFPNPLATHNC